MEGTEAGPRETPSGTRRTFFQWATAAAATLIGLGLAIPLVGYVVGPAFKRREQPWVDVGEAAPLAAGEPTQLDYMATARDGSGRYHAVSVRKTRRSL